MVIRLKSDIVWWMSVVFVLCCFFPFVGLNLGTDMQPFAAIFGFLLIICCYGSYVPYPITKYKNYMWISFLIIMSWMVFSLLYIPTFSVAKRMFSYFSMYIIPLASYFAIRKLGIDVFFRLLKISIVGWGGRNNSIIVL